MATNRSELHPLTLWAFFSALTVGVVASDNSFCALAAIGCAALVVKMRRQSGPWGSSFRWSLVAGIYLMAIRLVAGLLIGVPRPGTTLFTLPRIYLPDWLPGIRIGGDVTLERISSSLHEGLIIATVIALFGAANSVTSPHKLLRTLPSSIYQVGVALTIATSVLPQFVSSVTRIRTAQLLRNGRKARLSTIAIPLLEESLSRAVHLAESMESRGFGTSKTRSRYKPFTYQRVDTAYMAVGAVAALVMVVQ